MFYLHLCAPIEQVFDEAGYNNKTGSKLKLDRSSKNESIKSGQKLIYNVTTKNLLEFTPKVKEIFESCQLRQKTNDYEGMETFNGTQCNGWFDVIKYLSNTDCCLKLSLPPWIGSLDDTDVAFDPFAVGIVRSITLKPHTRRESDLIQSFLYFGGKSWLPRIEDGSHYWSRLWLQESQYILQSLWDTVSRGKLKQKLQFTVIPSNTSGDWKECYDMATSDMFRETFEGGRACNVSQQGKQGQLWEVLTDGSHQTWRRSQNPFQIRLARKVEEKGMERGCDQMPRNDGPHQGVQRCPSCYNGRWAARCPRY